MFKKSMIAAFAAAAVLGLSIPAAAETFTSADGVLSLELPGDTWKEMDDPMRWIVLSDGANMITVDHYSNGEDLPDMTIADSHYVNVYQAVVSTQNEVFIITGSLVDSSKIGEVCETIMSAKVLKYDTKMAVKKEAPAPTTGTYSIVALDKTMYATAGINVRAGYSTNEEIIGALALGDSVKVTGTVQSDGKDIGWYQIVYNGGTGFVSASFVSDTAPAAKKEEAKDRKSIQFTGNAKTIYDPKGNAITVYEAADHNWYDNTGKTYTATTDYEFTSGDTTYSINKPQINTGITPTGDSFTVYWANGNSTILTPYSDGYYYSNEWVRYTQGDGKYYGADGTELYPSADAVSQTPVATGDSVTVYWSDGSPEVLYKYTDGTWYTSGGLGFADGGDGNFHRTDGQTLYGVKPGSSSGSSVTEERTDFYPTGNTLEMYWGDGSAATLYEYSDGYWYTDNGLKFSPGGDGNYYSTDGSTLFPRVGNKVEEEAVDYLSAEDEMHLLASVDSGAQVTVSNGGGAYYDINGTEYNWIEGGQMMDYYGNVYNVIW